MKGPVKVGRSEEATEHCEADHLPGGTGDRYHHCRRRRLLLPRMPSVWMAENEQWYEEVLVWQELVLSVWLLMIVCIRARVRDKAKAIEFVRRHASDIEECLFDELPLTACPNRTGEKGDSRIVVGSLHVI
jgi:hypothetical protein